MTSGTTERWQIAEIPERFEPIAALGWKHGYMPAIFGSTVKRGEGRDLDIMMLRMMEARPDYRKFLAEFGGTMVRRFERPERGNHSYEVEKDGRLFHFIFGRF